MARLTRYLVMLFLRDTLALFGVAAFLLYLIQCISFFDVVSDKGQSLITLAGLAALGMPSLGVVFLYACIGIGLGRALRNLQGRSELHIIHVSGLVPALLQAIAIYLVGGALLLLFTAHVLEPFSRGTASTWTASIAADVVSRAVVPHKFIDVVPGVSIVIGSRDRQGNITNFFADDHRAAESRRTYFAESAVLAQDEEGYVLRLTRGAVQYMPPNRQFAQISFDRYDLALDSLVSIPGQSAGQPVTSIELVQQALAAGTWNEDLTKLLLKRSGESMRVLALGLFIAAVAAFPTGRRRRLEVPIEVAVLGAAFLDRTVSSYLPGTGWMQIGTGSLLLGALALVILAVRLRLFRPARLPEAAA